MIFLSAVEIHEYMYRARIKYSTVYSMAIHSNAREPNLALWPKFFGSLGGVKNSIGFGSFDNHDLALLAL